MRILKLLAMGLAGYALYELGQALFSATGMGDGHDQNDSPAHQADQRRALLSGARPEGMRVDVAEDSGTAHAQVVGRGVIR